MEEGLRIAVRMNVSDRRRDGESAEVFKVFTFREPDDRAVLLQDCAGREDALGYLQSQG
jgi:hypothetical protein